MPVYHDHQLVHIHIPKTAGTAIYNYFARLGDVREGRESWVGTERRGGRWYELQHVSIAELRAMSDGDPFAAYETFAVVRDPYERLVSAYLWRGRTLAEFPDAPVRPFDSFEAFLAAIPAGLDSSWEKLVHGVDEAETNLLIHLRPQHHYLCDRAGVPCIDEVLRYESLATDMARLLLGHGRETAHFRTPPRVPLEDYYDRAALDLVNDVYARDFETLGYERV